MLNNFLVACLNVVGRNCIISIDIVSNKNILVLSQEWIASLHRDAENVRSVAVRRRDQRARVGQLVRVHARSFTHAIVLR
jgi:hypothetical protein